MSEEANKQTGPKSPAPQPSPHETTSVSWQVPPPEQAPLESSALDLTTAEQKVTNGLLSKGANINQPNARTVPGVAALVGWAALAGFLTLVNRFAGYYVPLPPYNSFTGHLLAMVYLCTLLLSLLNTARAAVSLPLSTAFLTVAGLALSLPSLAVLGATLLQLNIPALTHFYAVIGPVMQAFVNNFVGPVGLCFLGAAIGRVIKHPNTLLAGAGFAIFFDIVVVTMGTVRQLMNSGSNLIAAVSVGAGAAPTAPPVGAPHFKIPDPISGVTIGPADVLFIALFLSSVWQMRLSSRSTFAWMFVLLGLALILVETIGLPIPALAPMGIAVLIANARHAAFTRTEKRDLAIGAVFAVFCAALMVIGARRFVPAAPLPPPRIGFAYRPTPQGFLEITGVMPGSPAARAGLQTGDLVEAVNGVPMRLLTAQTFAEQRNEARSNGLVLRVRRTGDIKGHDVKIAPAEQTEVGRFTSPP